MSEGKGRRRWQTSWLGDERATGAADGSEGDPDGSVAVGASLVSGALGSSTTRPVSRREDARSASRAACRPWGEGLIDAGRGSGATRGQLDRSEQEKGQGRARARRELAPLPFAPRPQLPPSLILDLSPRCRPAPSLSGSRSRPSRHRRPRLRPARAPPTGRSTPTSTSTRSQRLTSPGRSRATARPPSGRSKAPSASPGAFPTILLALLLETGVLTVL